jgi:threonine aldolase
MIIDLRSDTVTKPTPGMLDAIMKAKVGDDVFGEDPSINELESMASEIFGKEAALFSPSGTMSNQIGIKCHTQPGEEVVCEKSSHVYLYEAGGIAFNSGCQVKLLDGQRGMVNADQIQAAINPDDVHRPRTALVCLENTVNRGGGGCYDLAEIIKIKSFCSSRGLPLHLDGARLFNALVAKKEEPKIYGELFDSISVCLNKGLGCPIGSILMGSRDYIRRARRIRKVFGGGMRQGGYMAAAGIYALSHHVSRLQQDHEHASLIGAALREKPFVGEMLPVETNIVIFEVIGSMTARELAAKLATMDIRCIAISPTQIRMVTHLDISPDMVQKLLKVIEGL